MVAMGSLFRACGILEVSESCIEQHAARYDAASKVRKADEEAFQLKLFKAGNHSTAKLDRDLLP